MLDVDHELDLARSESQAAAPATIAAQLKAALGERLATFVLGADRDGLAGEPIDGQPDVDEEHALRQVYAIYLVLAGRDSDEVIRAWLVGMNPMLGDEAPAKLLAERKFSSVMTAARSQAILS